MSVSTGRIGGHPTVASVHAPSARIVWFDIFAQALASIFFMASLPGFFSTPRPVQRHHEPSIATRATRLASECGRASAGSLSVVRAFPTKVNEFCASFSYLLFPSFVCSCLINPIYVASLVPPDGDLEASAWNVDLQVALSREISRRDLGNLPAPAEASKQQQDASVFFFVLVWSSKK